MQATLATVHEGKTITIACNLQLYSPDTKEPDKPMYLSLRSKVESTKPSKIAAAVAPSEPITELITDPMVYPNPFSNLLNISFYMADKATCSVSIYTMSGSKVYEEPIGKLPTGNHRYQMQLNLTPGSYTVRLAYGNKVYTSLLIKK